MAENIDLNINIGANVTDLQAQLQKAENLLKQFESALKKATNIGEINYLNTQIKTINASISSLSSKMSSVGRPTADATNALSNLSRVAQDAPYGFIGIANNLNPLLESFQRLSKETGSSKKALESLLEGLSGAGGLGLALGAISSLAVVFSKELSEAFKGPSDKLKTLREELKKLNDEIYKVAGSAQASQTLGSVLVGSIADQNLDISQRQNALKKFKDLYTQNKEIQDLQIKDLKSYNAQFLQTLNNKASIQQLEIGKEKNYTEALSQANAAYKKLIQERDNLKANTLATTKQLEMGTTTAMLRSAIDAQYVKPLREAQQDIEKAKASLSRTLSSSIQYDTAGGEDKKGKNSPLINFAAEENKRLNLELAKMKALREKMKAIGLDTITLVGLPSEDRAKEDKRKGYFEKQGKSLIEESDKSGFGAKMQGIFTKDKNRIAAEEAEKKRIDDLTKSYNDFAYSLSENVTNGLMGVWSAMEGGQSAMDAFGQMFANIAKQIAAAVIQALIFKALLEAFPALKGAFAAMGVASSAGGFGKLLGMASGGVATGPTLAMIGEGSESEAVLPLSKLSGMLNTSFSAGSMSGGGMGQGGQFILKGNDLVLALNRANNSLNLRRG